MEGSVSIRYAQNIFALSEKKVEWAVRLIVPNEWAD